VILMILKSLVPGPVFFILGLPITILFVALAFYKPYGQPLGSFAIFGAMYFLRPKIYIWKRTPEKIVEVVSKKQIMTTVVRDKHVSSQSLHELAGLLDSEGVNSNPELEKLLKSAPIKK